eukprot:c40497_g1_i1 orf=125-397(-)
MITKRAYSKSESFMQSQGGSIVTASTFTCSCSPLHKPSTFSENSPHVQLLSFLFLICVVSDHYKQVVQCLHGRLQPFILEELPTSIAMLS